MGKTVLLWGFLLFLIPSLSLAQEFPTKPINILIGYATGGTVDIPIRVLAGKVEKILGQPFVITNNGGGGGSVALGIGAKQKPDGYHLIGATTSSFIFVPQMRTVAYKHQDFVPIMQCGFTSNGTVVRSDSPWKTHKELVDYAKANPGKITYSTTGAGTPMHLIMEYIARQEGIRWIHIPYQGGGPALTALLGGHVAVSSSGIGFTPHVRAGTVRLLATQGEERIRAFPDTPTLKELGYKDFTTGAYIMLAAPKGTPPSIVKKLDDAFRKAMDDPQFIQTMTKMELDISYRNSQELWEYMEGAYARLDKLIIEGKIPRIEDK